MGTGQGPRRGTSLGLLSHRSSDRERKATDGSRIIGSAEEHALFTQRYGKYPRSVVDWKAVASGQRPAPKLLTDALRKPIARVTRSRNPGWCGFVVTVESDDGMTWSASAADQVVESCSDMPRHHIVAEPRVDGFPGIVELLPKRRLIALAQEAKAVGPLNTWRPRSIFLAVLALLAVGALTALVHFLTKGFDGLGILVPICGALLVVLTFVTQEVSGPLKRSGRADDERRLLDALETAAVERGRNWTSLVESLSEELAASTRDRAVIVDNFDRIDPLTRETIIHFFSHRSEPTGAHEVWVVFEDAGLAPLSKKISLGGIGSRRSRRVHLELLRQTLLDEGAMRRLAAETGMPDRADFRLVKSIAGEDSDAAGEYASLLDGQFGGQDFDVRPYGPLELAYLLAVQHRTGAWAFREQDLASDLSSKQFSAHPEILRMLLPQARLNRDEALDAVRLLKENLKRMLDSDRVANGEIELITEAADILIERRDRYDLPAKDVVHLYWALYWYSKLVGAPNVDGYRLRKLSRHLVLAATPGALEVEISEETEKRFREALIWTAGALVAASLPEDVGVLLERAERETEAADERARLRTVCWQAYAVLGDEELLGIILRLHPGAPGAAPTSTDPESLFVESLRLADPSVHSRSELAARLLSLDREISLYGQVRGLWLALTVNPVIEHTWSRFDHIALESGYKAQAMLQDALDLLDDPTRPRVALVGLSVSLGIWTFALGTHRGFSSMREAIHLLDQVRDRANDLQGFLDDRRLHGESEDYVLRALANEIELMVGAAALIIRRGRFDIAPSAKDRSDLGARIRAASGTDAGDQVEAIARRMTLQELTWRTLGSTRRKPLGFDELASLVALRRVHLSILAGNDADAADKALASLGGLLHTPGQIGLATHTLVMRRTSSQEIGGHLWARAAALALRSDFGPGLEIEICLVALSLGHSFSSVPKLEVAERLVTPSPMAAERSAVWARLTEFDERYRDILALYLLNAARYISSGVGRALFSEAKALRDHTADATTRDEIDQVLELFELDQGEEEGQPLPATELLARWRHRSDSGHYAWMIYMLARRPSLTAEVVDAGVTFLEAHQDEPRGTTPILLAFELATTPGEGAVANLEFGRQMACQYLDQFHPSIAHELSAEVNIGVLQLLLNESTGDRERHFASMVEWQIARQERDSVEKLPVLADEGKYFLVLWHYCETLYFFGLRTEPVMDLEELLMSDGQVRTLAQWRAAGEPVPEPMVPAETGVGISADFVRFGRALFGKAMDDPSLDDARMRFDEASRDALPQLFDRLEHLRDLPERMRTLLTKHHAQLSRGTSRPG
jgi:hypothetical protein